MEGAHAMIRCPWCDGTGQYAATKSSKVPCFYCEGTGDSSIGPGVAIAVQRALPLKSKPAPEAPGKGKGKR